MKRVAVAIRDGWLIFGVVLALCVGLEVLYRTQGAIRRGVSAALADPGPAPPIDSVSWFDEYEQERLGSFSLEWEPYVYYRRQPLTGTYINVDSSGHRTTVQTASPSAQHKVFFFGGSTMFGSYQRDGWTIPSVAARMLDSLGVEDAHVVNYGETGYVSTQEAIALLLALRDGERPDVVVFYDGINDVASAVQSGRGGWPQNEANRAREFRLGRTVFHWEADPGSELRAGAAILGVTLGRSRLIRRILAIKGEAPMAWDPNSLADDVMESYAAVTRLVETLGDRYGFMAAFVWQPTIHATGKPLTRFEAGLRQTIAADPPFHLMASVHELIVDRIDSVMAREGAEHFFNQGRIFDGTPAPIFVDAIGHTVEAANPIIVSAFMPTLLGALRPATGATGGDSP